DGVDDYVSVPDQSALNPTDSITVDAWVKFDSITDTHRIVSKGSPWIDGGYEINLEESLRFGIRTGGEERTVTSAAQINVGEWYHVAGTYDGNSLDIYVNGVLSNTVRWTPKFGQVAK
ncbi:MAG: LamG domain-containing protein, partial [Chloroflexi bacterium]|nr:LamG domain-containing protein [Chloroflexota bacterium]